MSHTTIHATSTRASGETAGTRRLQSLLTRRDKLALAAAVFEAHDLGDPAEIRDVQYNVEAQLQTEYGTSYERLLPAWVTRDAELAHTWDRPTPVCPLCREHDTATAARPAA